MSLLRLDFRAAILTLFAAIIFFTVNIHLADVFLINVGWTHLIKAVARPIPSIVQIQEAKRLFSETTVDSATASYYGLGTAELWSRRPNAAIKMWRTGNVPAGRLLAIGTSRYELGDMNGALTYFMGADALSEDMSVEARIRAGVICQRTYFEPHYLINEAQAYCRKIFSEQSDNLIVNGTFASATLSGWQASVLGEENQWTYGIEYSDGQPIPSAVMHFRTQKQAMGLLQRVYLMPGTRVRFGAWLHIKPAGKNFEARILHIQYQRQGKSPGNSLTAFNQVIGWTYFEREFQLPVDADGRVTFLPVLANGEGQVWIDNVTVTMIRERQ